MVPRIQIDLSQDASTRWHSIAAHRDAARALVASYVRDLGGEDARALVSLARDAASTRAAPGALAATSCGRFDRATALVREHRPRDPAACLELLADPGVRLASTAQQMVLSARRGVVTLAGEPVPLTRP